MEKDDLVKELTKQAYLRGYAEGVLEMTVATCPAEGSIQHNRLQEIVAGIAGIAETVEESEDER